MLDLLSEFANAGIVYYERGASEFYPTRLCTTLNAGGLNSIQQEDQQGFLVVETNYRIYAYTCTIRLMSLPEAIAYHQPLASRLQRDILALFVDIKVDFSGMIVAKMTRDSIKRALQKGISSQQIISYLSANLHPQLKNKVSHPIIWVFEAQ